VNVPLWVWVVTILAVIGLFALDLILVDRRPHAVGVLESARWVVFYVVAAVLFGVGMGVFSTGAKAKEFFAGYLTEYSLSVDNLFVFIVVFRYFGVAGENQHRVLFLGILGGGGREHYRIDEAEVDDVDGDLGIVATLQRA